ncbi:nucleoside phosphorylase [Streptococcus constellatus subsp. pharyngis]|uniref:Uridine phosphorylase n=1 Tax=Streptococcus constellatus subsp. pharyngis SK1060 = CCUG 46377 TaxID=1035184 RepID=F9P798_STRCV|nr:nucleoside phosphorylase [Streptococcus constellatus]AGU73300.1 phosphorylase Pnp/Udp family protein [Streptococcus constellatus subsp. pharyngis C232]AGU75054.1 phosphorylase Pnp/Udp family protein [Streptococcus constellatus subsp. pharyngis C818]AGU80445.1 phosphorylase Pnp/Udp family protein [Streptococcus constellatus subsp. pharyngis C1050]EGV08311.1 phosphorylase family protein [Streptococcus constellatus subsp. pharyngis SK1060 = CCUG 46377]QRP80973.1 nucleoside phosphorylase [Strep
MILEEFDNNRRAIINPEDLIETLPDFPELVVSCFARATFERMLMSFRHEQVATTSMANIEIPIYRIIVKGIPIALFNAPVGASACVAILEDLIAFGMKKLVLFGTCGVLDEAIKETSIIVPQMAIRDEGTSYHYLPASDEIEVNVGLQDFLISFLDENGISHSVGKFWTTDGIYRETAEKLYKRKEAGAICVDMECSAVAALADFRKISICHFFYAADHLFEENWDMRNLSNHADLDEKDKVANLAIQIALAL